MGLKKYKPRTASLRFTTLSDFEGVSKKRPERRLVQIKKSTAGRNSQGRITIPPEYRDFAGLSANVIVVGVEIGVEIWDRARWQEEQKNIMEHAREKGERELADDLLSPGRNRED